MTSFRSADALTLLGDASGLPVAPQVAATLDVQLGGDPAALGQAVTMLRPAHLAGTALLPDPLPAVPAVRDAARTARFDDDARRFLLCASVAVTDRAAILLAAAGADLDRLLRPPLADVLAVRAGRFRLTDPRVRIAVHDDADLTERTSAHAALARAARQAGDSHVALWHTALSTLAGDDLLADGLLELADRLLARGDAEAAHAVAREATAHATGPRRARAFLAAGRAALWSGHLTDAEDWWGRAGGGDAGAQAARWRAVTRDLLAGPARSARADGPAPGAALARTVEPLAAVAETPVDRAVLTAVTAALHALDRGPDEADALLGQAAVAVVPAPRRPGPWAAAPGATSPLAEAHLRVVQALLLVRGGRGAHAAAVLTEAADRLPVAQVADGLATEVAASADRGRDERSAATTAVLAAALRALRGAGPVAAGAATRRETTGGAAIACSSLAAGVPPSGNESTSRVCATTAAPGAGGGVADPQGLGLPSAWAGVLTNRESDVVELVAQGMTNREVASRLCVSVRTVEVHLGRAFRKLGVRSRSELVVLVLRPVR